MKNPTLLIVDDDRSTREGLENAMKRKYEIYAAESAERALEILADAPIDIVLSDIRMPGMDGLTLLHRILARTPQPACVLMTAYGSIDKAVEAIKQGASDYIAKPYSLDDLEMRIQKALRARTIEAENRSLRSQLDDKYGLEAMVGSSEPMQSVFDLIRQIAPTQATVTVLGESGTGKELVARAIHGLSPRSKAPFVPVHCASLSQNLMESELFGHEKGAFTGASERRIGRFEIADGGTLFLDEVSEIDPATQTKLLRVLEERCFERVGGNKTIEVDIRLIVATNKNLKQLVEKGVFRDDLYFRLNVVSIELPPLRERRSDIPLLCNSFIHELSERNAKPVLSLSPEAAKLLEACAWPGNVRELRNIIEKMVVLAKGPRLTARDVPPEIRNVTENVKRNADSTSGMAGVVPSSMEQVERMMIATALENHAGNRTKAALQLGISRRTLHRKLQQYRLAETQGGKTQTESVK
ncbi:MAG: sigma-54-dependent Fis family transcriptional regulator [Lentisphaerales bacterium]|nr:MAG: sigma-54-dependent Fis family transcriptional regulator [Lentisphaerales bacterium]